MNNEQYLEVYRHSLSHILAKAVIEIFGAENVQYAIGPQISDGFYYDFLLPRTITEDDFPAIENKMREILKRREDWKRDEVSKEEALELFKGQKYKTEIIEELEDGETISIYHTGDDFVDLCRGPHVDNSQELMGAAFKIRQASGAYWRGDEKRDMLQRIYVYAFPNQQELKAHLAFIKEALERDHKKIGTQLDLFMFSDTAPGMPYWLPRGWKLYNALMKFSRDLQDRHGYQEISAPLINYKKLWVISGHWAHYQNNMFLVPGTDWTPNADDMMAAKPMNCPNAMMTYKRTNHSYKELPIRYSEMDVIHRKEKSGQMNGLFRVQEFRQDDDHTFVSEDLIESEVADIISIADTIYSAFGLTYRAELSTRPDDFMGDIEVWNKAESILKEILNKRYGEGNYEINEGDGAFYGPKIDLQIRDALGREWQCGTIQLDFQLPHNFELTYTDKDGSMKEPIVIHRALYGSFERFIGIIIEHLKGRFPFWLNPYQVAIVPIRTEHNDYAKEIEEALTDAGIRVEADYQDKHMNEKLKFFRNMMDPYVLVVGDKERENRTVSVTVRGVKTQLHDVPLDRFIEICKKQNKERNLELISEI
ncbi:MAG: threonine--tRNA ligase [Clostridia bacterium]|nr:threonine--tRNA ligase [Clostridia bacterium]MBR3563340.1 threonine--tRNA ligase [Clostridia bacterium]MBR4623211.1 threonine--tRNA ligase [Clostridia bacterium]MBR6822541.1 threonine--tRNA ligase [Clostridia bacterium]